jgi:hypothetical protein
MTTNVGYTYLYPEDMGSELAKVEFACKCIVNKLSTMKLVQVSAVHSNGAVAAAGTVDVIPLVTQIDGNGNAVSLGTVYGIPWYRLQGGLNAVICDPQVNDIGYVVCADRDSSSLKRARQSANFPNTSVTPSPPGSRRKYSLADGIYVGGCLNATPNQYLQFTSSGIVISDMNGNSITFSSSGITVATNGTFLVNGIVKGGPSGDQVTLHTHKHSGVAVGAGVSGSPVAGT